MTPKVMLYLRKSTDEHQADSIDTQRTGAQRFVATSLRGEVIDEVVDEGESRAEFKRRPGFLHLLARCAAKDRDFDVIVVRDESRLGAGARLTVALDDILAAGVRVYYYASGQEVRLDSPEHRIVQAVKSAIAESERDKIAERTREHLEVKARKGLNVGGRCYGYDNVRTEGADGKGSTSYSINPTEAAIVVECCERYAAGWSERAIARDLNARGVASPQVGRRGTRSWSPSCVREIIRRPRYRGLLEWGRIGAAYKGGTRVTFTRKRADVVMVERPELRIVSVELDEAVQARIKATKELTGGKNDFEGRAPKYLLSGKAVSRCSECGGPMQVANSRTGAKHRIKVYVCAWRRDRGAAVCSNAVRRPVEAVDGVFVRWVHENVLTEQVILATLAELRRRLAKRTESSGSELATVEAELGRLDREIKKLVAVSASLDDTYQPEELAEQIEARSKRRRELRTRLDVLRAMPGQIELQVDHLEHEARTRLDDLRAVLVRNPAEARRLVEALLAEPITFTPKTEGAHRFELSGSIATGAVFRNLGDPTGT